MIRAGFGLFKNDIDKVEIDALLARLISLKKIRRRRIRKKEEEKNLYIIRGGLCKPLKPHDVKRSVWG